MRIKSADGHESNVTGQGQGNLNTVLGAIGTYGALNSGALGGLLGGGCDNFASFFKFFFLFLC